MIKKLLEKWSCSHVWELYQRVTLFSDSQTRPDIARDTLICQKCGKIKKITL